MTRALTEKQWVKLTKWVSIHVEQIDKVGFDRGAEIASMPISKIGRVDPEAEGRWEFIPGRYEAGNIEEAIKLARSYGWIKA